MVEGHHGFNPPGIRPEYEAYRSPVGPKYTIGRNFHGINSTRFFRFGATAAMFGGVLGIAGLFFVSDIPRVRIDIMEKIPVIGSYWHKEVPPEDNPF